MNTDYSKMSDFEINKRVAIALDIDMHFYIPESEGSFQSGFLPAELGPIWQTSAGFVGEFTVSNGNVFNPCNNPADAWPIIIANKISIVSLDNKWIAAPVDTVIDGITGDSEVCFYASYDAVSDVNPLRAAMIVFLMMQESKNAS